MKIALTSDTHYGYGHKTHRKHIKFLNELNREDFDVLVHCGDWSASKQTSLYKTLKMFREALGDKPILTSLGNHDLWDINNWDNRSDHRVKIRRSTYDRNKTYRSMIIDHHNWMEEFNIHHLAWNPYQFEEEVMFYGFDGWYYQLPVRSNDVNYMPRLVDGCAPIDMFLSNEAHKAVDNILFKQEQHKKDNPHLSYVCCTHHAPYTTNSGYEFMCANPRFLDPICSQFDMFL